MANILVVEDDADMQDLYRFSLGGHMIFRALTVAKARDFFRDHQNQIAVIVLDGNMDPCDPERTTVEFALYARRKGFRGPMIACSSCPDLCNSLQANGCSHVAPKDEVADLIRQLLCVAA